MFEFYVFNLVVSCYDMDSFVCQYLDENIISFEFIVGKGVKQLIFNQIELEKVGFYVVEDVDIILCLYQVLSL